ncbi:hypothetical protein FQR65_LT17748 [Abscondita terminalis]|nr:hypothetical protein FQR65_LT17748 [Abscondita terminalis]
MQLRVGRSYKLSVRVEGQVYESVSSVPPYVEVENYGLKMEREENYYRYLISVNNKKMEFAAVLSDKFNDGLSVSHDIANEDNDFSKVMKSSFAACIDKVCTGTWNDFSLQSGIASPANPTSNITKWRTWIFQYQQC